MTSTIYNILVVKETRADETRVALIPKDVEVLIKNGHSVSIESDAGLLAGYSDNCYQSVGAKIINIASTTLSNYKDIFRNFNLIFRVKRPCLEREKLENKAFLTNTIMVGALDPFEKNSEHVNEYHHAGLLAYSIDQAKLSPNDPMNVLAAMSRLTGKLALQDAISKCSNTINSIVIIGLGTAGQSALDEAITLKLPAVVIVGDSVKAQYLETIGIESCIVDRALPLLDQQQLIASVISNADIIITTARKAGQRAPLLIPQATLEIMKPHSVIVDLALSEGGNVYGSKHDETVRTINNILITNISGYPKIMPQKASELWSKASLTFILRLASDVNTLQLDSC